MSRVRPHTVADPKDPKDQDALRRALRDLIGRWNDFSKILGEADGSLSKFLRADLTWAARGPRCIGAGDFFIATPADWTAPTGGVDYYASAVAGAGLRVPLPVEAGERIVRVGLSFYRNGANNPSITLTAAGTTNTAATVTPEVAWSMPTATGAMQELFATYSAVTTPGNWYLRVTANNIGDRVRAAYLSVA